MSNAARQLTLPPISYYKTMSLFLVTQDGAICTVEECRPGPFRVLMEVAAQTSKHPDATLAALASTDYDYRYPSDKWHAILALMEHSAAISLFSSRKEAETNGKRAGNVPET